MEEERLSPKQAAHLLSISTRTLRRWAKAFKSSLSETAKRESRKRYFDGMDIETLKRAKELLDEGFTIAETATRLTVRTDEKTHALMVPGEMAMIVGQIQERSQRLVEEIEKQGEIQDEQAKRLERLERWARQPWWKKIISKPEDMD